MALFSDDLYDTKLLSFFQALDSAYVVDNNASTEARLLYALELFLSRGSGGNTDSIAEGSTNRYFTETRVRNTLLTGLLASASRSLPVGSDSLALAMGKVLKYLSDLSAVSFSGAYTDLSGTPASPNPTTVTTNSSASGSVSWAWTTAINVLNVTTAGNVTFANPTGLSIGQVGTLFVVLGGAGHTLTFGANWIWPNSVAPTLPTTSGSKIEIQLFSDGTNVRAFWVNNTQIAANGSNFNVDATGSISIGGGSQKLSVNGNQVVFQASGAGGYYFKNNNSTTDLAIFNPTVSFIAAPLLVGATAGLTGTGSLFDILSTTKGSRPFPPMTTTQRDAITGLGVGVANGEGIHIFNLTTHTVDFWNGTVWKTGTTN